MIEDISLIAQSAIRIKNKDGKVIYFDPFKINGYSNDADYIFITHSHFDHFSPEDILKIKKETTKIITPNDLENNILKLNFKDYILVMPDSKYMCDNIEFETIPAYNINKNFHKKDANWVGYIVCIDDERVYVAGDTDNTPEARNVKCDIACVPIGGTYTMDTYEAVELIKAINPKLAIPIHYETIVGTVDDALEFKELLDGKVDVNILMK